MAKRSSRERLLDAARELMLSKGYSATRVDEICEAAGASKGSFYHSFGSKEELGLATLSSVHQEGIRILTSGPHRAIEDPLAHALAFVDHAEAVAEEIWAQGCLLGSFATELGETHPAIRAEVSRLFTEVAALLAEIFAPVAAVARDAGRAGAPSAGDLAEQFLIAVEGSIVLARAHGDPSRVSKGVRTFRRSLDALLEPRVPAAESVAVSAPEPAPVVSS